jgi:hypothetical protein
MYTTFVLRALGYDDTAAARDFQYDKSIEFGSSVGIVDYFLSQGDFLRDNMVAVSFLGLKAQPKDKSFDTLLDKLVDEGAVSAAAAKPILSRFHAYDKYISALLAYNDAKSIEYNVKSLVNIKFESDKYESDSMSTVMDYNMKMIAENGRPKMLVSGNVDTNGTSSKLEIFYVDGYMYYNIGGQKYKMPVSLDDSRQQIGSLNISIDSLYRIKDIQKTVKDGKPVYIIDYVNPNYSSAMDSAMSGLNSVFDPGSGISVSDISVYDSSHRVVTGEDGLLVSTEISANMKLVISADGESVPVLYEYKIVMDVVSIGEDLEITIPTDLSAYGQIS